MGTEEVEDEGYDGAWEELLGVSSLQPEKRATQRLLKEADAAYEEGRYMDALRAAEKARERSQLIGDIGLQVQAARKEAGALSLLGHGDEALKHWSWILAIAEDPTHRAALADEAVAFEVAGTFSQWVLSALSVPSIQVDGLFQTLDAGDRFVRAIGKPQWRAALLLMRARVLSNLGRAGEAIGFAEAGLALALRARRSPNATLGSHR